MSDQLHTLLLQPDLPLELRKALSSSPEGIYKFDDLNLALSFYHQKIAQILQKCVEIIKYNQLNQIQEFSDKFLNCQNDISIQVFDMNKLFYYTISKQFVQQIFNICKQFESKILSNISDQSIEQISNFFENTLVYQYIQTAQQEYNNNKKNNISNDDCDQLSLYKLYLRTNYLNQMKEIFKEKTKLENLDKEYNIGNQIIIPINYFSYCEENYNQFVNKMNQIIESQEKQILQLVSNKIEENQNTFNYWYVLIDYKNILQNDTVSKTIGLINKTQEQLKFYFDQVNQYISSIDVQSDSLNHEEVRQYLSFYNRVLYNISIIQEAIKTHKSVDYLQFQQQLQDQQQHIQSLQRKFSQQLLIILQQMYSNTKIEYLLYFNKDKKLQCGITEREENLYKSILHLYEQGYDKKIIIPQQLLTFSAALSQLNCCQLRFQFYCKYYEKLFSRIKNYLKPLIINLLASFEREMYKGCQATRINLRQENLGPQIEKIKKVQGSIEKLVNIFEQRLLITEKANDILIKYVQQINDMKTYDRYKILNYSSEIKNEMQTFKSSPNYKIIEIYFTGAFCYVLAGKQKALLEQGFKAFNPLKTIELQSDLTFQPSIQQVNNYFNQQLEQIRNIPEEMRLTNSDNLQNVYNEMSKLTIKEAISINQKTQLICKQLQEIQQYIYDQCKVVTFTNDQLLETNQSNIEECIELVRQSVEKNNKQTFDSQELSQQLICQFPQLVQSQDNQNIYYLQVSDNSVALNKQSILKVFAKKDNITKQIGIKLFCEKIKQLDKELYQFISQTKEKLQNISKDISAEQLKEVLSFVSQVQEQQNQYKELYIQPLENSMDFIKNIDVVEIKQSVPTIEKIQQQFKEIQKLIQKADKEVETKKKQLLQKMQEDIQGNGQLQILQQLCEQIKVTIKQQYQLFSDQFVSLSSGNTFQQVLDKLKQIQQYGQQIEKQHKQLQEDTEKLHQTIKDLKETFPQNYNEIMNIETQNKVNQFEKDVKDVDLQCKYFIQQADLIQKVIKLSQLKFYDALMQIDEFHVSQSVLQGQQQSQQQGSDDNASHNVNNNDAGDTATQQRDHLVPQQQQASQQQVPPQHTTPITTTINKLLQQTTQILQMLKSSCLKESHFDQIGNLLKIQGKGQNMLENLQIIAIFENIGKRMYTQATFLTSEQLSPQYKKFIIELKNIILLAENEFKIGQEIERCNIFVQQQCIITFQNHQLNPYSTQNLSSELSDLQRFTPVNGEFKSVLQKLQENTTLIASIKDNKYSRAYKQQTTILSDVLEQMIHNIHKIIEISQQIKVLEPVISQKVLQDVIQLFYQTLEKMQYIYKNSQQNKDQKQQNYEMNCYKLIKQNNQIDQQLDEVQENLSKINIKLKAFLENKRLSFSKLFFLSDNDVLELFSNYQTINKHVKKLFSGVEQVQWKNDQIVELISQEGEILKLNNPITVTKQIPVDQWLKQLDREIKSSLKQELFKYLGIQQTISNNQQQYCIFTDYKCDFTKIPIYLTSDILILVYAIYFSSLIDKTFSLPQESRKGALPVVISQLQEVMTSCTQLLTSLSTAQVGTKDYINYLKAKNLATDLSQYIQQTKQLCQSTAMTWQHSQLMLLRIDKQSNIVEYHCQNIKLMYNFEYQGLIQKLIFTPLTEKQFQTLVSSISLNRSTNSIGMAGTGKTESVKSFANRLGRNCVVFNCDSSVQREDLQRIMKGVILSGAIGCFDEVNRLSETVLSGISKDVELILLDQWITEKVERDPCPSHIFLTMNPPNRNYRGRNTLPFSLTKLLRICYMDKPDTSLIIEKILETNGFKFSKNLSEKIFLVFQLSKTLVPKEVYLDWGLRSIQNVLREASLMKSDIQRTQNKTELQESEETKIIIKSLQNQTLSKLTPSSQKIYQEILDALFGTEVQQDCNIKTELEVNLYNSIVTQNEHYKELAIQLFKSLTNKLGVCLLGDPASGKTKIRYELFKAVNKLSQGKIQIKEYLLSPKAVSRQDLLGYVDSTTKQWIDGSLTKAARQAVKDLDQKEPRIWPIIVFDGQIDPAWIEALNSCLDDNRLLSLSSGERIKFPMTTNPFDTIKSASGKMPVNFLFETDSLEHASPATVSRLAVILVAGLTQQQMKQELQQDGLDSAIDQLQNNKKTLLITSQAQLLGKDTGLQRLGQITNYIIDNSDSQKDQILQSMGVTQQFTDQDAYDLLIEYFNKGKSVIVEGPHESGKTHIIEQIAQELNNIILIKYQINKLSTREDIFYLLRNCTQEIVDISGEKILKPQHGKKVIILLQSVDMSSLDEYNHSEIQNVIFSIVKHGQLYMQTGQCYKLENIMLALTSTGEMELEQRIVRSMGYVKLDQLDNSTLQSIIKSSYQNYNQLAKNQQLIQSKQNAIQLMENLQQQFKDQQNINNIIITPNLYKINNLKLNIIQKISQLVNDQQKQQCLIQLLYLCSCSNYQQRQNFMKTIQQQNQLITWQKIGSTVEILIKQLQVNDLGKIVPDNYQKNFEFVNFEVRLNMLNEILDQCKQYYNYQIFQQYINNCDQQTRDTILQYLSATELSCNINRGTLIVSQPNNFSIEITQIALLYNYYKLQIVACEPYSFILLRNIIEQIISGVKKIALIIDNNTIQMDLQYIKFISIILSNNKTMLQQLCPENELKQLQEKFSDTLPNKQNLQPIEIQNLLFQNILDSLHIVIFINAENRFSDQIVSYSSSIEKYCQLIYWPQVSIQEGKSQIFYPILKSQNLNKLEQLFTKPCQRYQHMLQSDKIEINPVQFSKQLVLTNQFIQLFNQQLTQQVQKYSAGLKQLQAAQAQVDILSKDAIKSQQAVKASEEIANKSLVIIQEKMKTVEENKVKAAQIEKELKIKEGSVFREKEQAEAELDTVKPIIEQAKQSVASIPADAIREVKGFNNPPMGVQIVLQAVCTIMGVKDLSWKSLRQFISQQGILKTICAFDPSKCQIAVINKVEQLMKEHPEAFQQEKILRVSKAAAPLALWVEANIKYLVIFAKVEPLIRKCEEANKNLKSLREELVSIQEQVTRLTQEADVLRQDYQVKQDEVLKLKAQLLEIEQKKNVGIKMLDQLKDERVRWSQKSKQMNEQLQQLIQTSGLSAALYIFAGCETDDFRQNYLSQQRQKVDNLVLQPEFISKADQVNIIQQSNQNYENIVLVDQFMKQQQFKVLVLTHVNKQNRVLDYIEQVYKEQIQIVSSLQENLSSLISIGAKYGKTVVLTQCDTGSIPSAAIPYLSSQQQMLGIAQTIENDIDDENQGQKSIQQLIQDISSKLIPENNYYCEPENNQQIEIAKEFKLIIVSSIQLQIPSDLQNNLLQLSFAPTNKSRIKYYIDTILSYWSLQSVEKLNELKISERKLQFQQEEIEKDLLDALQQSTQSQNILEDKNLIQVLNKSEEQSKNIQKSLQLQEQTKQQLNQMTEKVQKLAVVVQKSVNVLSQLNILNDLYVFDDNSVISILNKVLQMYQQESQDGQIADEQVNKAIKSYLNFIYTRINQMVQSVHKVPVLILLLKEFQSQILSQKIYKFFANNISNKDLETIDLPSWVNQDDQKKLKMFIYAIDSQQDVDRMNLSNFSAYSSWINKIQTQKSIQKIEVPNAADFLNIIQKAMLIVTFRPEFINSVINIVCDKVFGEQQTQSSIQLALEISTPIKQPIIVFANCGQDIILKSQVVNIVPGKEDQADQEIQKLLSSQQTTYVVVKGANLCRSWLQRLSSTINNLQSVNTQSQLILVMEPINNFPVSLLQISQIIFLQQTINPKKQMLEILSNMFQMFREKTDNYVKQSKFIPQYIIARIFYCLAAIHCIIESRQQYTPRGLSYNPGFTTQNILLAAENIVNTYLQNQSLNTLINTLPGNISKIFYNVQLKDKADEILLENIINLCFNKEILQKLCKGIQGQFNNQVDVNQNLLYYQFSNMMLQICQLFFGIKYVLPPAQTLQCNNAEIIEKICKEYIQLNFPEIITPEFLCLMGNAMQNKAQQELLNTENCLVRLQGAIQQSSDNQNNQNNDLYIHSQELLKLIQQQIGPQIKQINIDLQTQIQQISQNIITYPLIKELQLQLQTIINLQKVIEQDLEQLDQASQNYLLQNTFTKQLLFLINSGIAPERWTEKFDFVNCSSAPHDSPHLVSLQSGTIEDYFNLLIKSANSINNSIDKCIKSENQASENMQIPIDLHLLPRPLSFLEAARRYIGKAEKMLLNQVELTMIRTDQPTSSQYPIIVINDQSVILEGCQIQKNNINYEVSNQQVNKIYLQRKLNVLTSNKTDISFYVDQQRTTRVSVVENIQFDLSGQNDKQISIYGIYCHLNGR